MIETPTAVRADIRRLRRSAPRDRFFRAALWLFAAACVFSWALLELPMTHPVTGRSILQVSDGWWADFIPYPLRREGADGAPATMVWNAAAFRTWAGEFWRGAAVAGAGASLALSVIAIVLAGLFGWAMIGPASHAMLTFGAILEADRSISPFGRAWRAAVFGVARFVLLVLRAIPEYVWAFLFLLLFGPVMVAGALALALHHTGVLGKLGSELAEDMDQRTVRSLAAAGAADLPVQVVAVWPRILSNYLVYFFYSWEQCLREATILGILGLTTLGFHVHHAFAQFKYDEALYFILINSVLVVLGDLVATFLRRRVRTAGRVGI